jgi:hypothetical protein
MIGSTCRTVDYRMAVGSSSGDEWDVSSRPKTSQDVVEASLALLVSSTDMRFTSGTDTWIGGGARAATSSGWEAATRPLTRALRDRPPAARARIHARDATRQKVGVLPRRRGGRLGVADPARRKVAPVALLSDAGGPSPLTEDRQKTETSL